jgi:dihydroxyacetone kinase-like protein
MPDDEQLADTWMRNFAASVAATERELTALDQQVGDGDFGVNLLAGTSATLRALSDHSGGARSAARPLKTAADVFLDEVGGTSGPLFGLLLQEMAVAVAETGPVLDTSTLALGAGSGLAAIQRVGEAAVGDKTLVDALEPACAALKACSPAAEPREALLAAANAAWEGVQATARLRARRGRASYVGGRAEGVPDPGAVGVALLFSSAGTVVTRLAPLLARSYEPGAGPGR